MEIITSRKNQHIRHFRRLASERSYRKKCGEFVCDGQKLLTEALQNGAQLGEILVRAGTEVDAPAGVPVFALSDEVYEFVSPLENSPGPLFSVKMRLWPETEAPQRVIVLENVQDPGNVGTVLRTAAALGIDRAILVGECADVYNPKTVRGAMGALFRQNLLETDLDGLCERLKIWGLPLYGAALATDAETVGGTDLSRAAVAVGNEGRGLTPELLDRCDKKIIIPMTEGSESLNAAVAASILMWEMARPR